VSVFGGAVRLISGCRRFLVLLLKDGGCEMGRRNESRSMGV